jgi:hypothetical protein
MTISCFGASLFFFVLATYSLLKQQGDVDLTGFEWIPVTSLSLVIFIASLGIISLPFVITTELLPNKVSHDLIRMEMKSKFYITFLDQKHSLHDLYEWCHRSCFCCSQSKINFYFISTNFNK